MEATITYTEKGSVFETFKFVFPNQRKILVKKDGKPHKVIHFVLPSGRMMKPTESVQYL